VGSDACAREVDVQGREASQSSDPSGCVSSDDAANVRSPVLGKGTELAGVKRKQDELQVTVDEETLVALVERVNHPAVRLRLIP
jgi:hypothetical protein